MCRTSCIYIGVAISSTARCFIHYMCRKGRWKAIITAMKVIKNPRVLSVDTALKLFKLKIAPIATYGVNVIWTYLTVKNLVDLDKLLPFFLKRVLGVSLYARNRLVYQM